MYLLLKMVIFQCHVSFQEGIPHTKYKSKDFPTLRHPNTSKYLDPPKTTPKTSGDIWMSREHTPDPNHQQLMNNFLNHLELKGHASGIFSGVLTLWTPNNAVVKWISNHLCRPNHDWSCPPRNSDLLPPLGFAGSWLPKKSFVAEVR